MAIRTVSIGTLEDAVQYDDGSEFAMVVDNAVNQEILVSDGNGQFTAGPVSSGGAAPIGASYVVLALDGDLTSERRLQGTVDEIALTDGGAGGDVTLGFPTSVIINTLSVTVKLGVGTNSPLALLNLHAVVGSNPVQFFSDDDIAHGMTVEYPTNVFGVFDQRDAIGGGFRITGLNDGDGTTKNGLVLRGFQAAGSSTTDQSAVKIDGAIKDGSGIKALGFTDLMLEVYNFGTSLMSINGGGDMVVTGDMAINGNVLTSNDATFGLLDVTPTKINFGGAAAIDLGASGLACVFKGTLNVDEAVTFDTTLGVTGVTTLTGDLIVDTDTLFVDAVTGRVGILNAIPAVPLDIQGSSVTIARFKNTATRGRIQIGDSDTNCFVVQDATGCGIGPSLTNADVNIIINSSGFVGMGTTNPLGRLHVDQNSLTAAIPVVILDQADIDDTFINFIGASAADGSRSISSDTTEDSAKFGAYRVELNGVTKWVRVYDNES